VPFLLLPLSGLLSSQSHALASAAEQAYAEKNYQKAGDYYLKALEKTPANATLHFNSGTVAYKSEKYDDAISSFNQALQSDDLALQKKAYYNLGNAHYRRGETLLQNTAHKTKEHWQEALTAYTSSLRLDPENEEARFNHDFVKKKLEELERQENQQQNQQDQSDSNQQEDKDKSQGQDQEQQQGDEQKSSDEPSPAPGLEKEQSAQSSPSQTEQDSSAEQETQQQDSMSPQQMSVEEAQQLLQEMQNEEGTLNFLPKTAKDEDKSGVRNW
jgi:Ca-activated chloride channel family protein